MSQVRDGRPERVFLVGYYGFDNLGDEAIRMAIERAAPRFGASIVHYATRGPSDDPRAVPVRGRGAWRYLRAIATTDRVVLGGGGILKDEGLWLPAELFATAVAARLLRRPVSLLGVGVGPFYRGIGRALIRATARLAAPRTVRDAASGAALGRLGIHDWVLGADPVFSLEATGPRPTPPSGGRRAVVAIRPWFLGPDGESDARRRAFRRALGAAIAVLAGAGWTVCLAALHWPRDRDEARRLVDETGLGEGVEVLDRPLSWDELVDLVGAADLVVAMRYHALAAAAVTGRPVVALAYEPKVAALAEELGVDVIPVDAPDLAELLVARLPVGDQATGDLAVGDGPAVRPADPAGLARLRARAELALRLALSPARPVGAGDRPPTDPTGP